MKVLHKTISYDTEREQTIGVVDPIVDEQKKKDVTKPKKSPKIDMTDREQQIAKWMENIKEFIRNINVNEL